jgi:AcrR family transcriptional regulator
LNRFHISSYKGNWIDRTVTPIPLLQLEVALRFWRQQPCRRANGRLTDKQHRAPRTGAPTGPRRRPGGRSARVRRSILDATVEALVETGYAGLSVDEVARRAGVHKTTIYRRWPDVGALIIDALLDRQRGNVPIPDTGELRSDLLALLDAVTASITSPDGRALLRAAQESGPPELESLVHRFWHARFALAREIFQRAADRGEIAPELDHDLMVELAVAPLFFRQLVTREPLSRAFRARLVDALIDRALAERRRTRRR